MATDDEQGADERPGGDGSFRLFSLAGVDVNLHWTWFLAALLFMFYHTDRYQAAGWNVAESSDAFGRVTRASRTRAEAG